MSGHDRRYQLDGEFVTINMVPSTTEKTAVLCSLIIALCLKKKKKKRIWCKEWLNRREILGSHTTIGYYENYKMVMHTILETIHS